MNLKLGMHCTVAYGKSLGVPLNILSSEFHVVESVLTTEILSNLQISASSTVQIRVQILSV